MIEGIKKIGIFILCILMFIVGIVFMTLPFTVPSFTDEEWTIDRLYSSKGIYFGLDYAVVSEDEKYQRLSKSEINDLHIGDTYIATKKESIKSAFFMGLIAIPFGAFMIWFVWVLLSGEVFVNTKLMQTIQKKRLHHHTKKRHNKFGRYMMEVLAVSLIITTIVIYSFIGRNVFYKINPVMTTQTQAEIMEKEEERGSFRGSSTTYTFTIQYEDQSGIQYESEKDVSSVTYRKYKVGRYVPIKYVDKNPYNTFIRSTSLGEAINGMLSILFKLESIAMLLLIYINYFFIKRYIKMWKSKRN